MARFKITGKIEANEGANNVSRVLKEIVDKTGYEFTIESGKGTFQEVELKDRRITISSGLNLKV